MRLRLDVAYKGTEFHGFARQRNDEVDTVAGRLEVALFRFLQAETKIVCAGRTDAGVHALGQVISFDVADDVDVDALVGSLNKQLGQHIAITGVERVGADFDARFSARARHYRYLVSDDKWRNPLTADTVWWVGRGLDVDAMNDAAQLLLGEHDFSSFCRRPDQDASLVRNVSSAVWRREASLVRFEISANAFCHQMVRSIVGQLVAVGLGRRGADDTARVLASRDRSTAATIAPPHGLCLVRVDY